MCGDRDSEREREISFFRPVSTIHISLKTLLVLRMNKLEFNRKLSKIKYVDAMLRVLNRRNLARNFSDGRISIKDMYNIVTAS